MHNDRSLQNPSPFKVNPLISLVALIRHPAKFLRFCNALLTSLMAATLHTALAKVAALGKHIAEMRLQVQAWPFRHETGCVQC